MRADITRGHPLSSGLVLAMSFDGYGLSTYDASGRQNNGTFGYKTSSTYQPSWDKGPDGTVVKFVRNGTTDGGRIDCGSAASLNGVTGLSFVCRMKFDDFTGGPGNENGICSRDFNSGNRAFFFYAGTGGALKLQINGTDVCTGLTLTAGVWYTLAFTGGPGYGWQIYVGGAPSGSLASWTAPTAVTVATTLGPREYPSNEGFVNGAMSSACFWDRLLSQSDMQMLGRDPLAMLRPQPWNWLQAGAAGGPSPSATIPYMFTLLGAA